MDNQEYHEQENQENKAVVVEKSAASSLEVRIAALEAKLVKIATEFRGELAVIKAKHEKYGLQ
jgi:hypothetical protein